MTRDRFLLYQSVVKHAAAQVPVTVPVAGEPPLAMLIDGNFGGLYLLGPFDQGCGQLVGAFDTIQVERVEHWGKPLLKVGTSKPEHFQQVLALLCDIADLVQIDRHPFAESVAKAISNWRALLAPVPVLSGEAERGLLGELWLLERMLSQLGPSGLDTWQGPTGELHDFSVGRRSYEVKTTLGRERIHAISNLRQLLASTDADLYVVSLQLQPDGASTAGNLPKAVEEIRELLRTDSGRLQRFSEMLGQVGYDERHRERYETKYKLRTKPVLVKVDDRFPAITPAVLRRGLSEEMLSRIIDVEYSVSLENLGDEDGCGAFLELLPPMNSRVLP